VATKQVEIPGVGPVILYKRRGNRSLRLTIGNDGQVRVTMPYWLPYKTGEQFAVSRIDWITQHRSAAKPSVLQHGQQVGKAHHLHFTPSAQASRVSTRLKPNEIEIQHPLHLPVHDEAVQAPARAAAIRALRKEAEQLLPYRLKQLAERDGFEYANVAIKQMRSRWGSCSSKKEIVLNLYLMQLPWHLIDYVLFHELTHTKVMQHGDPFWREMELHVPYAKRLRKEIGNYHPILMGASAP
jgi:predicted metal-dependent hydrolase